MSRNRSADTGPEVTMRKALWALGWRYRLGSELPGRPDVVLPSSRLVVFVDGCFWHGCAVHGVMPKKNRKYWTQKLRRNMQRDAEVTRLLRANGWSVIRVWEHDVANALNTVVRRICERARARRSRASGDARPPCYPSTAGGADTSRRRLSSRALAI